MKYAKITYPDINNGIGCRVSIFTQGCNIRCKNCFNSELWDENKGKEWSNKELELIYSLLNNQYIDGISWLGGEPTLWTNQIADINRNIRNKYPSKTIWLYSGYTLKELLAKDSTRDLLYTIDVLVDGRFEESKKDSSLSFCGSSNQKIWDIKKSIKSNKWVEYEFK